MRLLIARPKSEREFALVRLKVYGRGNINLPKTFLETLGIDYKSGGEVIAEANPLRGEVILRRKPQIENLPTTSLENFPREEAYVLRGAYREAEDFFKELAEGIKAVYHDAPLEVGTLENGEVYLKLGPREVFEEIHLSYRETPHKPKGVITLDGGVPQRTESGYEITPQMEENLEFIKRFVKGRTMGNGSVELIEAPKFTRGEAVKIGLLLRELLDRLFVKEASFKR